MIIKSFKTGTKKKRKGLQAVAGFFAIILILGYFLVYRPYRNISNKAKAVETSAKQLKATFKKNDIDLVKIQLNDFSNKYNDLEKASRAIYWLSFIPYISDYKNGIEAGSYMVNAAKESVDAIAPYADLIGFKKGESSFVERSAEDRLQTAVLTLDKVLVKLDSISEDVRKAEEKMKKINPNRYPEKVGKTFVRSRIVNIKDQFDGLTSLFVDAKPLLKKMPEIFGKDGKKTYLILFQNEKERRATGGFLTSYAVFTIEKGRIKKESSDDIYELDKSIPNHPKAPPEILTYHKGVSQLQIRDSNISPDFVESLKLFTSLYNKSSRKVNYDGIITLDSKVLVDMLTIFGDTEAGGIKFSAKEDKRCDCPQVIYTLFDIVDRPVNYIKEDRKGILGQLMQALLIKILGFSPSRYWGPFVENTFTNLHEKHILLNFNDKDIQDSVEKLNFAGRIRPFDGDYLHINNVNFAGAKSNLFVSEDVTSKTTTGSSGVLEREVTIQFKNPYPPSDCNLERGGLCLNATLRNWIRVYVPKGSKLVSFTGSVKPVKTYDDLGKTTYEGFLLVNPRGAAKVVVKYTLPSSITLDNYQLMVQKQASVDTQTLRVDVNGKKLFDAPFKRDVILNSQ